MRGFDKHVRLNFNTEIVCEVYFKTVCMTRCWCDLNRIKTKRRVLCQYKKSLDDRSRE